MFIAHLPALERDFQAVKRAAMQAAQRCAGRQARHDAQRFGLQCLRDLARGVAAAKHDAHDALQRLPREHGSRQLAQPHPQRAAPAMLRLGRQDIDISAGERRYTVTDSYVLPVDIEVQAIQPHAHYRAREIRGVATLPDGSTKWLIYIKDWDFRWQHVYRYQAPFRLPAGSKIEMAYAYDNSAANGRNPQQPPVRALWGQRSSDEMGDLWIQVTTADLRDLTRLNRDFRPKAVSEDLVGYESLIRRDPDNAGLHDDAALLCLELGSNVRAIAHFEASARLSPGSATARFNVGTALALEGRIEDALDAHSPMHQRNSCRGSAFFAWRR